jgi:hypothetical protein
MIIRGNAVQGNGTLDVPAGGKCEALLNCGRGESLRVSLGSGATLSMHLLCNDGASGNFEFSASDGATLECGALFRGNCDVRAKITMCGGKSAAKFAASGFVRDGTAKFNVDAIVLKGAPESKIEISEAALMLGEGRCEFAPALAVHNGTSDASHSSSMRELNPNELFYLMSRGFSEADAAMEIAQGTLEEGKARIREIFGEEGLEKEGWK